MAKLFLPVAIIIVIVTIATCKKGDRTPRSLKNVRLMYGDWRPIKGKTNYPSYYHTYRFTYPRNKGHAPRETPKYFLPKGYHKGKQRLENHKEKGYQRATTVYIPVKDIDYSSYRGQPYPPTRRYRQNNHHINSNSHNNYQSSQKSRRHRNRHGQKSGHRNKGFSKNSRHRNHGMSHKAGLRNHHRRHKSSFTRNHDERYAQGTGYPNGDFMKKGYLGRHNSNFNGGHVRQSGHVQSFRNDYNIQLGHGKGQNSHNNRGNNVYNGQMQHTSTYGNSRNAGRSKEYTSDEGKGYVSKHDRGSMPSYGKHHLHALRKGHEYEGTNLHAENTYGKRENVRPPHPNNYGNDQNYETGVTHSMIFTQGHPKTHGKRQESIYGSDQQYQSSEYEKPEANDLHLYGNGEVVHEKIKEVPHSVHVTEHDHRDPDEQITYHSKNSHKSTQSEYGIEQSNRQNSHVGYNMDQNLNRHVHQPTEFSTDNQFLRPSQHGQKSPDYYGKSEHQQNDKSTYEQPDKLKNSYDGAPSEVFAIYEPVAPLFEATPPYPGIGLVPYMVKYKEDNTNDVTHYGYYAPANYVVPGAQKMDISEFMSYYDSEDKNVIYLEQPPKLINEHVLPSAQSEGYFVDDQSIDSWPFQNQNDVIEYIQAPEYGKRLTKNRQSFNVPSTQVNQQQAYLSLQKVPITPPVPNDLDVTNYSSYLHDRKKYLDKGNAKIDTNEALHHEETVKVESIVEESSNDAAATDTQ